MSDSQVPKIYDNPRRSTRVPIQVQIEVEASRTTFQGETVVVNLQGALIKVSDELTVGDKITLHVSLTGKSAAAQVVFADPEQSRHFGVELARPENIWGIVLAPEDWEVRPDEMSMETIASCHCRILEQLPSYLYRYAQSLKHMD